MDFLQKYIGSALIILGCLFNFVSAIGISRMRTFYAKLHAAGVGESCGSIVALLGILMLNGFSAVSLKILLLIFIVLIMNPTATNLLINSAIIKKTK